MIYGTVDGSGLDTGTITIYKDADAVCTLVIGVDHACPPNSTIFDVGNYTLNASLTFPAGSPYEDSNAAPVTISIAQDPTSIALTSSASPAALGTPVTFTATVSGSFPATPTGQVIFTVDDGAALPAVLLDAAGTATLTATSLALGQHTITAAYAGATDFLAAQDASFKQQIVPPATVTTIASSLNPSTVGESITFTSIVSPAAGVGVTPTGAVTFKDGTASFATVLVTPKGGQYSSQTSISTLAAGTHSITAIYSGDAATSASVSRVLVQQVDYPLTMAQPGYNITVTPASLSLAAGATAKLTVTVTAISGYAEPVTLSCGDLPNESACTFADQTIPAGGGVTTLALTTMSPHDCGSSVPYGGFSALRRPASILGRGLGYEAPALAGALVLLFPRKRRGMKVLLALAAAFVLCSMTGCGGRCTDFGTSPGHYTFKVVDATPVTPGGTAAAENSRGTSASVALSVEP